ncbi:MAG: NAD+ synthase [Alphaproteobacteria bacterium]
MLRFGLWQGNPLVGDIKGNLSGFEQVIRDHANGMIDVFVASECYVTGYPVEDLLDRPSFREEIITELKAFAERIRDLPPVIIGAPWPIEDKWHNAALFIQNGAIQDVRGKYLLPDYGVFDDSRIFSKSGLPGPMMILGHKIGVMVCADMWEPEVAEALCEAGAEILLVLNGSPYEHDKLDERIGHATARVVENDVPLIYLNMIGGQDHLVFDGGSFALSRSRQLCMQLPQFKASFASLEWNGAELSGKCTYSSEKLVNDYQACVLGLRDYVLKNGFHSVLFGLSGGIDSALVAAMAVDALGADNVEAVMMPSRYTSKESVEDAQSVASLLGITLLHHDIDQAFAVVKKELGTEEYGTSGALAEENLQSRMRGMFVMARSNMTGALVLTTGNKSEYATGYATLYGDMCGAYAPIKDVYKSSVFAMAKLRNTGLLSADHLGVDGMVMPERVISKPPSAELRPDQVDEESLGSYEELDRLLHGLLEKNQGLNELVQQGFDEEFVRKIIHLVRISEYKRSQSAPGPKISRMQFTRERRYPITNGNKLI